MTLQDILNDYKPITLEEMNDIRLMNRIDTKFVTTIPVLKQLLEIARDDYYVQETGGLRISPYYTLYFDTPDCAMYNRHEAGHLVRQKLRIRSYVDAGLLRDRYGLTQCVFDPEESREAWDAAQSCRGEYVLQVTGRVEERSAETKNPKMATGDIEVRASSVAILNRAAPPPFPLDDREAAAVSRGTSSS